MLKRRFGIKQCIQLQWDFLFLQPSRAVSLVESVFLQPFRAVWPAERENVIQLQWDFVFLHTVAAKCLFLRSEFRDFSMKSSTVSSGLRFRVSGLNGFGVKTSFWHQRVHTAAVRFSVLLTLSSGFACGKRVLSPL